MDQKTLIDEALRRVLTQSELARRLGVAPNKVNEWHHDKRPCPVKHVAAMAELIGAANVAEVVGQVELARAGNSSGEARRGVKRGAVATLRGWLAVAVAAVGAAPGTERHFDYRQLEPADANV